MNKKRKPWELIFGIVIINSLILVFLLSRQNSDHLSVLGKGNSEEIATVGNSVVTREQWLSKMEEEYGKKALEDLINQQVVEQMAKKYHISISDKEMKRELIMMKTMYNANDNEKLVDESILENQIKYNLLLEELLTKDVEITKAELVKFYKENKDLYTINPSYHVSYILVKTNKEAKQVIGELKNGSSFKVLAMEKSVDEFTANQGGDLGYISEDSETIPKKYVEVAEKLKKHKWSAPVKTTEGYAILYLHEKIQGVHYSFEEVKNQIRRQIALEQMKGPISAKPFWKEAKVSWFYEKE